MSVEQTDVVDIMSVDEKTGEVVLTVTDHLEWKNSVEHQTILQKKFNAYLAFVESGEILRQYPKAEGRPVAFNVVFKYKPDSEGEQFLSRARAVIESAGFKLKSEIFAESYDN
jgi:nucleotide-binding universal stress UspA family protein